MRHGSRTETHQVKIPAGVTEGQRLRIAGRGEHGSGGGAAGDLYLRVRLAKHPDFEVEDHHLIYEAELAPWEAALGAEISVPTLAGRVNIKIPAGTQSGQKLRVRGRGLPPSGDLLVVTKIVVPAKIVRSGEKTVGAAQARIEIQSAGLKCSRAWQSAEFASADYPRFDKRGCAKMRHGFKPENDSDHRRHARSAAARWRRNSSACGHIVVGCGRSEREIAANCERRFRHQTILPVVDVASDEQVAAWAKGILESHGAPDLLLNNAGLINRNATLWEIGADEFSQVVDVNLKGVANVIRHFVPAMVARRDRRHREFQFRLGTLDRRGSRAVLRDEMGD